MPTKRALPSIKKTGKKILSDAKIGKLFLICRHCLWTASALGMRRGMIECPECSRKISSIKLEK